MFIRLIQYIISSAVNLWEYNYILLYLIFFTIMVCMIISVILTVGHQVNAYRRRKAAYPYSQSNYEDGFFRWTNLYWSFFFMLILKIINTKLPHYIYKAMFLNLTHVYYRDQLVALFDRVFEFMLVNQRKVEFWEYEAYINLLIRNNFLKQDQKIDHRGRRVLVLDGEIMDYQKLKHIDLTKHSDSKKIQFIFDTLRTSPEFTDLILCSILSVKDHYLQFQYIIYHYIQSEKIIGAILVAPITEECMTYIFGLVMVYTMKDKIEKKRLLGHVAYYRFYQGIDEMIVYVMNAQKGGASNKQLIPLLVMRVLLTAGHTLAANYYVNSQNQLTFSFVTILIHMTWNTCAITCSNLEYSNKIFTGEQVPFNKKTEYPYFYQIPHLNL